MGGQGKITLLLKEPMLLGLARSIGKILQKHRETLKGWWQNVLYNFFVHCLKLSIPQPPQANLKVAKVNKYFHTD